MCKIVKNVRYCTKCTKLGNIYKIVQNGRNCAKLNKCATLYKCANGYKICKIVQNMHIIVQIIVRIVQTSVSRNVFYSKIQLWI